jgi:hypothetical protein
MSIRSNVQAVIDGILKGDILGTSIAITPPTW